MLDLIQILLASVIAILTILLAIIGFEIFLILKEFKKTVEKANKILDDAGRISESVATPIEQVSELLLSLRSGLNFFKKISNFFHDLKEEPILKKMPPPEEVKKEVKQLAKGFKKRFFTKGGKTLVK